MTRLICWRITGGKGYLVIAAFMLISITITFIFCFKQNLPNKYLLQFDLQDKKEAVVGQLCKAAERPSKDNINLRNGYYQYFINDKMNTSNYFIGVYYDDRTLLTYINQPVIRINMLITVTQTVLFDFRACEKMPVYLLYWFQKDATWAVKCRCMIIFTAKRWEVNKLKYYVSQWECPIPRYKNFSTSAQTYVSVTHKECTTKPTTLVQITVPEKPKSGDDKKIAFIMKGWYGNWTKQFAPYLVSWIETLKYFGIEHLHASKDALYLYDDVIKKAVEHYKRIGFLSLPTIPTNFDETDKPYTNFSIDQIGTFLTVNDIFYKHMHKYWYVIHADVDEIIVPKTASTYTSAIDNILRQYPGLVSVASIAAPMAHFYQNYEPPDPSIPKHLLLLRQTYRTPVEKMLVDGHVLLDSPKSFINPRTCLLVGIHYCYLTKSEYIKKVEMELGEDIIMLHHYRDTCKKTEDQCHTDRQKRLVDDDLYVKHGQKLQLNVETVLKDIGYFKEQN